MILGIDPGLSGAWAFLAEDGSITAGDLPVAGGTIDIPTFAKIVRDAAPKFAVVEDVHSMPKQGVSSTFKFGCAHGSVLGVILALGVQTHMVAPTRWKRHFRLSSDKDASRALAIRMWPTAGCFSRKKDHGRAEAALIALWATQASEFAIPGAAE